MRREIEAGSTFSDALAKHPKILNKLHGGMIRAGETAGNEKILSNPKVLTVIMVTIRKRK